MKTNSEIIDLGKEKFIFTDVKTADSKFRLNLGQKVFKFLSRIIKIDGFQVFVGSAGDILLRPTMNIPSRETWIFENKKAQKLLKKGFEDISRGKTEVVTDPDKFFNSL